MTMLVGAHASNTGVSARDFLVPGRLMHPVERALLSVLYAAILLWTGWDLHTGIPPVAACVVSPSCMHNA